MTTIEQAAMEAAKIEIPNGDKWQDTANEREREAYSLGYRAGANHQAETQINPELLFWAFRYALGRQTYCVSEVVEALIKHWSQLSDSSRLTIVKEILEALKENRAGMEMDVAEWRKVTALKLTE